VPGLEPRAGVAFRFQEFVVLEWLLSGFEATPATSGTHPPENGKRVGS
jgi:hypothetical protein